MQVPTEEQIIEMVFYALNSQSVRERNKAPGLQFRHDPPADATIENFKDKCWVSGTVDLRGMAKEMVSEFLAMETAENDAVEAESNPPVDEQPPEEPTDAEIPA